MHKCPYAIFYYSIIILFCVYFVVLALSVSFSFAVKGMKWFTLLYSIVGSISMFIMLRTVGAFPFRIWSIQAEAKVRLFIWGGGVAVRSGQVVIFFTFSCFSFLCFRIWSIQTEAKVRLLLLLLLGRGGAVMLSIVFPVILYSLAFVFFPSGYLIHTGGSQRVCVFLLVEIMLFFIYLFMYLHILCISRGIPAQFGIQAIIASSHHAMFLWILCNKLLCSFCSEYGRQNKTRLTYFFNRLGCFFFGQVFQQFSRPDSPTERARVAALLEAAVVEKLGMPPDRAQEGISR